VAGNVFNVATGTRVSLLELLASIERIIGRRVEPEFQPRRVGDVEHSFAAIEQARQMLGYEPQVTFEEGLRRTIQAVAPTLQPVS